jgi:hypothetical protein
MIMPYALFDQDLKVSKAYPTENDVWRHAEDTGLVVDKVSEAETATSQPILDSGYQIKPCHADPGEDPARNEAEAADNLGAPPASR